MTEDTGVFGCDVVAGPGNVVACGGCTAGSGVGVEEGVGVTGRRSIRTGLSTSEPVGVIFSRAVSVAACAPRAGSNAANRAPPGPPV